MRNHTNSSPLKSIGECTVKRQSQQTATVPPAREPTIDTVPTRTYTQAPKASQYTQTRILASADRGSSFRHQQIHTEWFTHCVHCVRILHISLYLRIQQKLLRVEKFTVNTYFALCVLIAHPYTYRCVWISFSICFGLLQNRIFGCWLLFSLLLRFDTHQNLFDRCTSLDANANQHRYMHVYTLISLQSFWYHK